MHMSSSGAIGMRINNSSPILSNDGVVEESKWQHLLVSYDNGIIKSWKNGSLVLDNFFDGGSISGILETYIIHNNTGPIYHGHYRGLLDNFRFYPIAYSGD